MVSPKAIVFAVRALIRMGTATRDAFEQHARDADIFMPLPAEPDLDPITYIRDVFRDAPESRKRIIDAVEMIWQTNLAKPKRMFCSFRLAEQVALADSKYAATVPKIDTKLARMAQQAGLKAVHDCQ